MLGLNDIIRILEVYSNNYIMKKTLLHLSLSWRGKRNGLKRIGRQRWKALWPYASVLNQSISYLSRPKLTLPFSYSRFYLYHVSSFPLKSFLWIILFHIIIQSLCKYIFFFFELNLFVNIFSDKLIILSQPVFFMWEWKKKPECMTNLAVSKSYRINQ